MSVRRILLFCALLLVVSTPGCAQGAAVDDTAVEEDDAMEDPSGRAGDATAPGEVDGSHQATGGDSEETLCSTSSGVVSTVRDVYAVLAPEVVDGRLALYGDVLAAFEHVRFTLEVGDSAYEFYGYTLDGRTVIRAAVCPCCGESGLAHGGTSLVCHACGSTFALAATGGGGEDCGFPEGEVPYERVGGCLWIDIDDLVEAYERTAAGEAELFEPEPEPVENESDDTSWPRCCRR